MQHSTAAFSAKPPPTDPNPIPQIPASTPDSQSQCNVTWQSLWGGIPKLLFSMKTFSRISNLSLPCCNLKLLPPALDCHKDISPQEKPLQDSGCVQEEEGTVPVGPSRLSRCRSPGRGATPAGISWHGAGAREDGCCSHPSGSGTCGTQPSAGRLAGGQAAVNSCKRDRSAGTGGRDRSLPARSQWHGREGWDGCGGAASRPARGWRLFFTECSPENVKSVEFGPFVKAGNV